MKKLCVLVSLTVLALAGCGGGGGGGGVDTAANSGADTKVLTSISVSPSNSTVIAGATTQFVATGTYSDASVQDITASVTWQSSKPEFATISNDAASKGKATTVAAGTATITAVSGDVSGATNLTVFTANPLTDVFLGGEHHVGDGRWGNEPVNSLIPVEANVSTAYSATFNVTEAQKQFAFATITLEDRGVEASQGYHDVLVVNTQSHPLSDSKADGSYTPFSVKVPSSEFVAGVNTVTVQSGTALDPNDYDDFQFQNILIQFSN